MLARTLTISGLIAAYRSDPDSAYVAKEIRHGTRANYDSQLSRIDLEHGHVAVEEIHARLLKKWHEAWRGEGNHVAMAHSMIAMLRTLATFGATMLDSPECKSLKVVLGAMRFKMPKPRTEILTTTQVIAIRRKAHERGWHSLAFAQALQSSCTFRQKDVIGEWVPMDEPGEAIVTSGDEKWMRGVHWREVDGDLILRHVTSKRQKAVEVDLKLAPMVKEEMAYLRDGQILAGGPMVICELTGEPYRAHQFRRMWRIVANEAGVPKSVRNMDTRAGKITEALRLGAPLESVRKVATHSTSIMTNRYSRNDAEESAEVMRLCAENYERIKVCGS